MEAFEWQQWIEREEYIQECQMLRLNIVIKMFDKREREMHEASKSRIETACETIEQRRQAGLRKMRSNSSGNATSGDQLSRTRVSGRNRVHTGSRNPMLRVLWSDDEARR
ncbi:uncharacterized protein LOC110187235 [Drosophila serrata]|uniref:uncharacterized protein LOC110187235 n=1 Tax=Drosophila serrata TaxID=7274 RepID=UPI000A1D2FD1|nr:uncharacterized protein LOC110187235 [Drosophila serrata]